MDGKGRCIGNTFIERLWRYLKDERVHLPAWETGSQTEATIARWITFDNHQRPHAAHGWPPPAVMLLQQHQSRSAKAGSRLTQPEIRPKIGE